MFAALERLLLGIPLIAALDRPLRLDRRALERELGVAFVTPVAARASEGGAG